MKESYDIIVVGGGHAGSEAAHAAATLGMDTLLLCLNIKMIANMPCNPHIGGSAKGIVVREIDALGGIMGKAADANYLQIKILNMSKGPGVRSLRAQEDKKTYPAYVQNLLQNTPNLEIVEKEVTEIITEGDRIVGVKLKTGEIVKSKAVILTTGTHLDSTIMRGHNVTSGGPDGENAAHGLSDSLREHGIELFRLKTGTPPRIVPSSIDYSKLEPQYGMDGQLAFSFDTKEFKPLKDQVPCYLTYTNEKTHEIIRAHLNESAMYGGVVKGVGPRYCPSIEDKVVRFSERSRHQLFLEPESNYFESIYVQGFSTSMPINVQDEMIHSLVGLEHAEVIKYAYAIEYDAIKPLQFDETLQLRKYKGLYGAGQIIGTSGYEEAAALGLMAAINASLYIKGEKPFILRRDEAYIGIMIDDLVTKGTTEPYRLLSSRSEYRLLTRSDNADYRLMEYGYKLGLNSQERFDTYLKEHKEIEDTKQLLKEIHVGKNEKVVEYVKSKDYLDVDPNVSFDSLLRRQRIDYNGLRDTEPSLPHLSDRQTFKLETDIKYEGYINLEIKEAQKIKSLEELLVPSDLDFLHLDGISLEAREKLNLIKPKTVGEASRITNVHPADINNLILHIKKYNTK